MTGFIGTINNDILTGSSFLDIMLGFTGNDTLYGRENDDALYGGDGIDFLYGDSGNDKLYGEVGNDYLNGGTGGDLLFAGVGNDTILGGGNSDYLEGEAGNDYLDGGSDRDRLIGGTGTDTLLGGTGDDWLYGGDNNDTVYGGDNNDSMFGEQGNDRLFGDNGNDTLTGLGIENGVNTIDTLTGGAGADCFILGISGTTYYDDGNATTDGINDYALITDFNPSLDKIQLKGTASQYVLSNTASPLGTGIYVDTNSNAIFDATDELISIVQFSSSVSASVIAAGLNLNSTSFVYVQSALNLCHFKIRKLRPAASID